MHGRQADFRAAWVTLVAAALQAGVTVDVVKSWRYRGWRDSKTGEQRKLRVDERGRVNLGDVLEAERDTRRSGRSHRRLPPPDAYHEVA